MRASEFITEIERIPKGEYPGGKYYLELDRKQKIFKPLPGGSGLEYSIQGSANLPEIKIWDPKRPGEKLPIGKLTLESVHNFPLRGAVKVDTITVDEDYRGAGLAKALYGIALSIMRRPLVAGDLQTPGGRRNWVSLSQIPGVEVKGLVRLDPHELNTYDLDKVKADAAGDNEYIGRMTGINREASEKIDIIMGQLGGQYVGKTPAGSSYFAFDVRPNTMGTELEAAIKTKLSKVYHSNYDLDTTLYAVWAGK